MTPVAFLPDEPTQRVIWETIDDATVRVRFEEVDTSDGVPAPIEPETSRTTAVTIVDMDEALHVLVDLARSEGVPISTIQLRVDERTPIGQFRQVALCVSNWWRFRQWFPDGLRQAEIRYHQMYDTKKAQAVCFRMRLLAEAVAREMPPLNYTVLKLE